MTYTEEKEIEKICRKRGSGAFAFFGVWMLYIYASYIHSELKAVRAELEKTKQEIHQNARQ